jgi:agmatinase
VEWLLGQLSPDASVFLSFDLDGLDPSVAPAVSGLAPGGLTYRQGSDLVRGLAERCRIAGAAFTEMVPSLDLNGMTALVTVRLISELVGTMARRS